MGNTTGGALGAAADAAAAALATTRMPTTRNESFRFTDLSPLVGAPIVAHDKFDADAKQISVLAQVERLSLEESRGATAVLVNGRFDADLSDLSAVPAGVFVGPLSSAPDAARASVGAQSAARGGPFATLNTATAEDCLVVHVPRGRVVEVPVHVLCLSAVAEQGVAAVSPRVAVVVEDGGMAELVEEFAPLECGRAGVAGSYFVNSVAEVALGEGASLSHRYVETDGADATHVRATLVEQAERSLYSLTEVRLGGRLSRHDLGIAQLGESTRTEMGHFVLVGKDQLHDLHSSLQLDHPEGQADQLHKCIVAHAEGRGVFDGNVQVNRLAQRTDAGQLSRNLLLVPKATVNVKPNLQIVADDVVCTHGCAVSDLDDDQVFYFLSRGIDEATARASLVYSFGMEVVGRIRQEALRERLEAATRESLDACASLS